MAFTDHKITASDIAAHGVQSQPDKLLGTAAQNKAAFDALITEVVKEKLNGLIDALLSASAAGEIGVDTVTGITAETVQGALEQIMLSMQDITQGSVADGAITTAKLADGAVTTPKLTDGAVTAGKLGSGAVGTNQLADAAVTSAKLALLAVTTALLANGAVTTEKLANGAVTGTKLAGAAVDNTRLAAGAVTAVKLAEGAVTSAKLAPEAVTAEKLSDGAVTAAKLGEDIDYTTLGIVSDQLRHIYVADEEPSTAAEGSLLVLTDAGGHSEPTTVTLVEHDDIKDGSHQTVGYDTIRYTHQRDGAEMIYTLIIFTHIHTGSGWSGREVGFSVGEESVSDTMDITYGDSEKRLTVRLAISGQDSVEGTYTPPFTPVEAIPFNAVVEEGGAGAVWKLRKDGAWTDIG